MRRLTVAACVVALGAAIAGGIIAGVPRIGAARQGTPSYLLGGDPGPQGPDNALAFVQRLRTDPGHTTSHYEKTADPAVLDAQGCSQGGSGEFGLVVLDWGKPVPGGARSVESNLTFHGVTAIANATEAFATGWMRCAPRGHDLIIASGINNDRYNSVLSPDSTESIAEAHATQWASMVEAINVWLRIHGFGNRILAVTDGDFEVEWGPAALAVDWVRTVTRTGTLFFDSGTVTGCPIDPAQHCRPDDDPQALPPSDPRSWSIADVAAITFLIRGAFPLPEVYQPSHVDDWARLAEYVRSRGNPGIYPVLMTETLSNYGWSSDEAVRRMSARLGQKGMSSTDIGFG